MLIDYYYGRHWQKFTPLPRKLDCIFDKPPLASENIFIGIEIEAENYAGFNFPEAMLLAVDRFWYTKAEPSLRNNGMEFISLPIQGQDINYGLHLLNQMNTVGQLIYTDLAGLHIHLNIRNFTLDQLSNLAMLNVVFEESLYRISGNRKKNIYCCPSRSSHSGAWCLATKNLEQAMSMANKYLGFNYLTIKKFGTVEYRHSKGSSDVDYIRKWINILLCLHVIALKANNVQLKEELFKLNTTSEYQQFVNQVFGNFALIINHPDLPGEMSEGVSTLKEWFIQPVNHINSEKILDQPSRPRIYKSQPQKLKNRPQEIRWARPQGPVIYDDVVNPFDINVP